MPDDPWSVAEQEPACEACGRTNLHLAEYEVPEIYRPWQDRPALLCDDCARRRGFIVAEDPPAGLG